MDKRQREVDERQRKVDESQWRRGKRHNVGGREKTIRPPVSGSTRLSTRNSLLGTRRRGSLLAYSCCHGWGWGWGWPKLTSFKKVLRRSKEDPQKLLRRFEEAVAVIGSRQYRMRQLDDVRCPQRRPLHYLCRRASASVSYVRSGNRGLLSAPVRSEEIRRPHHLLISPLLSRSSLLVSFLF